MTEEEILKKINDPLSCTEPEQVNEVITHLNALIDDGEQAEFDAELKVNLEWNRLRQKPDTTNAECDREVKLTQEYSAHEQIKRTLAKFRRHRATLKNRYDSLAYKTYGKKY